MSDYSAASKMLHRLALSSPALTEMQFDLETMLLRGDKAAEAQGPHVFVCGLARAGTTILMRSIFDSGAFASLTYRDMPFVMAPNLWARMQGRSQKRSEAKERAHGDGIYVDQDSPEALEEVFWRTHCADDYLREDGLAPHKVDAQTVERFRAYVAAILRRYGAARYLSKNNNNILRIPALRAAFPDAIILVPFREPGAHARSLQEQHLRFLDVHQSDPFVKKYMTWLAHHEFGSDHRPFRFPNAQALTGEPEGIDYWVSLWSAVYAYLLDHHGDDERVFFVCYEDLCASDDAWGFWRQAIELPADASHSFVQGESAETATGAAADLYDRLRSHAISGMATPSEGST